MLTPESGTNGTKSRKRVAVFKGSLLPLSETFILEQVASFTNWEARLFGRTLVKGGIDLESISHQVLHQHPRSFVRRLTDKIIGGTQKQSREVARMVELFCPDVIHVHFGTELQQNWKAFQNFQGPIVTTLHGRDITQHPKEWESGKYGRSMIPYPRELRQLARMHNTYFIAVSHAIKMAAIAFGLPEEKIVVKHIGVDVNRFTPSVNPLGSNKPLVLFVGRMVEKKGIPYLLDAMLEVQKNIPFVELVLIGEGPELEKCKTQAHSLGISAAFLGARPHHEVLEWLHQATLLCLPSVTADNGDSEGFGMVILEAQSCGVPVVTSANGGREEGIEHSHTGLAFDERDSTTMAQQIMTILGNDSLRQKMSAAARQRAVNLFDIRKCTQELETYYNSLLSAAPLAQSMLQS